MVGQGTGRGQRVLDRRQLLDLLRGARPIAIVEIVAEKVFVILVVPGIGFVGLLVWLGLFRGGAGVSWLKFLGGDLLEHRILDHLLVQEVRQLQRRHRQQLDRLLQRWCKD